MNVQKNGPALRIRKVPEVLVRALLSVWNMWGPEAAAALMVYTSRAVSVFTIGLPRQSLSV